MRLSMLIGALLMAAAPFAPTHAQEPQPLGAPVDPAATCGASLAEEATAEWLTDEPLVADLTLDGEPDAALWGVADGRLVLLIEGCRAGEPVQRWRFPLELGPTCDIRSARVVATSLLLEDPIVERVCAAGQSRDECVHLRRENARRQALSDAGARELRVDGPACVATTVTWDEVRGGFMAIRRP